MIGHTQYNSYTYTHVLYATAHYIASHCSHAVEQNSMGSYTNTNLIIKNSYTAM